MKQCNTGSQQFARLFVFGFITPSVQQRRILSRARHHSNVPTTEDRCQQQQQNGGAHNSNSNSTTTASKTKKNERIQPTCTHRKQIYIASTDGQSLLLLRYCSNGGIACRYSLFVCMHIGLRKMPPAKTVSNEWGKKKKKIVQRRTFKKKKKEKNTNLKIYVQNHFFVVASVLHANECQGKKVRAFRHRMNEKWKKNSFIIKQELGQLILCTNIQRTYI